MQRPPSAWSTTAVWHELQTGALRKMIETVMVGDRPNLLMQLQELSVGGPETQF